MSTLAEDRKAINQWEDYLRSLYRSVVVDYGESPEDKLKRIADLEKPGNEEKWFKFYFPNYYYAEAAPFHKTSTRRLLGHMEYYLVRAWSRELAKDTRSMMEIIYAAMTKKKTVGIINKQQQG